MANVKLVAAVGLAAALAACAASGLQAAPVPANAAAAGAAAQNTATEVRWVGRNGGWRARGWWRPGIVIGGFAVGVAAAPYYYGGPYYDPGPYHYQCMTNDGQRRFRPCEQGGN
jgi:hypothetical protein